MLAAIMTGDARERCKCGEQMNSEQQVISFMLLLVCMEGVCVNTICVTAPSDNTTY